MQRKKQSNIRVENLRQIHLQSSEQSLWYLVSHSVMRFQNSGGAADR